MLHADNANEDTKTCLFDGVLFKMNDPDEKTHEVTFGGSDLEVLKSEGDTTYTVGADGQYTLSFPALNAGVSFKIPKIINMANCVNIHTHTHTHTHQCCHTPMQSHRHAYMCKLMKAHTYKYNSYWCRAIGDSV